MDNEIGNNERFVEVSNSPGHANLMEHRSYGGIEMLFDSQDMITELR